MTKLILLPGGLICDAVGLTEGSNNRQILRMFLNTLIWGAAGVITILLLPFLASAEFVRTCVAPVHKIADAIAPTVTNAHTGLNWLRAQPLDLEGVRRQLSSIANDGSRAGEIVVRLLRTTALGPPHRCIRSERRSGNDEPATTRRLT
jgi:hypothetical protein